MMKTVVDCSLPDGHPEKVKVVEMSKDERDAVLNHKPRVRSDREIAFRILLQAAEDKVKKMTPEEKRTLMGDYSQD